MVLYRILTEDIDRDTIESIVGARFPGFTILLGDGYWRGKHEDCVIIEIMAEWSDMPAVNDIAENIKRINMQETVLVQRFEISHVFI